MAGSRSLGTLTVDLVAKVQGFEQGMNKAERELDKRAKRMNDIAKKIGVGIGTAITAGIAGAVAAAGALSLITKQAIDNADAMRDMSIRLGTSTETLSAFAYAASQTGTDIDTLGRGLKVLAKNAADSLNPTSEQAKVFAALGVNVKDASGKLKDMSVLVPEIADKFKLLEDGTTKAALAQALFGKAGLDLTEFLNSGGKGLDDFAKKAADLGVIVDTKTAAAADEFNDTLGDLKTIVSGVGLGIARDLLPGLNESAEKLRDMARDGDLARNMASLLNGVLKIGTGLLSGYTKAVNYLTIQIEVLANSLDGLREINNNLGLGGLFKDGSVAGGLAKIKQAANEGTAALAELNKESQRSGFGVETLKTTVLDNRGKDFKNVNLSPDAARSAELERLLAAALSNPTAPTGGGKAKQLSEEEKEAKRLLETYQRLMATYDERIALTGKEGEAVKVRYDIERGELAKLTDAQKADLLSRAERLDQMNEELELQKKLAAEDARRFEDFTDVMQSIKDQTQLVGLSWEQQEIWNNLKWAGVDADSDWGRQIIASTKALQEQREAMEDQIEIMDGARDGAREFFDSMREGEGILKSLEDAFGRFADALYDWATNSLIDQFFGKQGTSGQGTAGGGWLSALFGSTGSSQGSLFDLFSGSWGFANGGNMAPYSIAPVNERGFEMASIGGRDYMLTGPNSVRITPNHMLGGGSAINQNFYTMGLETRRTAERKAQLAGRAAARAQMRDGH